MSELIKIGIGELNTAKYPDTLVTFALGSCVGICILDPMAKVGGLAHIMLPSSKELTKSNPSFKFADIAIPELVARMEKMGASRLRMKAKIAGGAKMFATSENSAMGNIGGRNVAAVKMALLKCHVPIIAEDTGKDYGRTVYFSTESGAVEVKSALKGVNIL